jgi:DHA2 family multidrug resistance protein
MAAGLFGMGIVLGPTLGPTLGGWIIEHNSWPLIFMINIPIGFIATFLAYTFIDKKDGEGKGKAAIKIDYTGILLLAVGIGCLQYVLERGESEEWFSSDTIRFCSMIAVVGLGMFIWYELSIKQPAVNLRVLGNRNLAFTTIFTFVAGFGLFTSVFIFPVLAQRVMGFTAFETGSSLLLPTLAGVIMMPIIGKLMSKGVTPIPFVIVGFSLFAVYAFYSANMPVDAGKWDFFWPLLIRAFGISLSQLPLINQAVVGLAPKDYASGISLNNMIRQLGGAFGIAMANNYVAQQYFKHRANLIDHIPSDGAAWQERVNTIGQGIASKTGDFHGATQKAYKLIDLSVDRQAYYLSYLDTFRLVGIFFIIVIPLVFFLRTTKKVDKAALEAASEAH